MYSRAYPPLAPPADPTARRSLEPAATEGIPAGAPLNEAWLAAARLEWDFRRTPMGPAGVVTRQEKLDAELRYDAIKVGHMAHQYGNGQSARTAEVVERILEGVGDLRDMQRGARN